MECETRERNLLAECMGTADWYLQIDSDEYFMDFGTFVNKLRAFKPDVPTSVYCGVVTLFRELPASYLLIDESHTSLCFATNNPKYDLARTNSSENAHIYWQDLVVHQSWAREPSEIKLKLNNWGHKDDFNTISFYNLWNSIDEFNYNYLRNFHPLDPIVWHKLILFKGNIQELLDSDKLEALKNKQKMLPPRKPFLSRLWKKIKKLFR
jgi:hypothetical protein